MASSFDVVIAGGGIAALEALLGVRQLAPEAVRIQLLAPEREFVHRPMFVAEPFGIGEAQRSSSPRSPPTTAPCFGKGALESVDTTGRTLLTSEGDEVRYDALLVAVGARPVPAIAGALTFGDPNEREFFTALLDQLGRRPGEQLAFLVPPEVKWSLAAYGWRCSQRPTSRSELLSTPRSRSSLTRRRHWRSWGRTGLTRCASCSARRASASRPPRS